MTTFVAAAAGAAFLASWAVISWRDWRIQRILNRSTGALAALSCALFALLAGDTLLGFSGGGALVGAFYVDSLRHAAITAAVAVGIWWMGIWPAGDAKLFAALGLLVPLIDPGHPYFPDLFFLTALINAFVPAGLGVAGWALVRRFRTLWPAWSRLPPAVWAPFLRSMAVDRVKGSLSDPKQALRWALSWLSFIGAGAAFQAVLDPARSGLSGSSPLLWLGLHVGRKWAAEKAGEGRTALLFAAAGAVVLWFGGAERMGAFGRTFLVWSLLWLALGWVLRVAGEELERSEVQTCEPGAVRPYMVLADSTWRLIDQDPDFRDYHFERRWPDGLTRRQAKALKGWAKRNEVGWIQYQEAMSFAFWIFTGYFLSWALRGDLVGVAARALRH